MKREPTLEMYQNDTKDHVLTTKLDNGVYRHLVFAKPNTSCYSFSIVTWPGYLSISGDMGCYVFSRVNDMFTFFNHTDINPQYWGEKIQAYDKSCKYETFDIDLFHELVREDARRWLELDEGAEIPEDVMDELYTLLHTEDEWECVTEMRDFRSELVAFPDFWDHRLKSYTYQYIWCCHAIRTVVNQYYKDKKEMSETKFK